MIREFADQQSVAELTAAQLGFFAAPENQTVIFNETTEVLENPGKGLVMHYYDNTLERYGARLANDDLSDIAGLTVVYLRLAWCYLEPAEGQFNWEVIDAPIRRWTALGKRIAFRISCCESGGAEQRFATPKWVMQAGAKGSFFGPGLQQWEPDYADPIFLSKLDNFLAAFAERYDGQPYVEFIDIGSYGIWGEWHTSSSSKKVWPREVLKRHVDLHRKHFHSSQLIILYGAGREVCRYARDTAAAGLRTDSVGVHSYYTEFGGYWTEKIYPQLDAGHFGEFWPHYPVVVEPAHYAHALRFNTWQNGSTLERSLQDLHPSWVTIHHWPREWYNENRELSDRLANKVGYWFFLKTASLPKQLIRGEKFLTQMVWENRGVAPLYRRCYLALSLCRVEDGREEYRALHPSLDFRTLPPGQVQVLQPQWCIPADITPGTYLLRLGLVWDLQATAAAIRLGIQGRDEEGFYPVAEVSVT